MQMRRWAVARSIDVVRHGHHKLHLSDVACTGCHHHACRQSVVAGLARHQFLCRVGLGSAQRHVHHIGTMLQSELHGGHPMGFLANSFVVEGLQRHDGGLWSDARLRTGSSCATNGSSHMRTVSPIIGRVIVVIVEVVAVIGIFRATIPKATGQVGVVKSDARVNDGNQNTCALIALFPRLRRIDLQQVLGDFASIAFRGRRGLIFKNPLGFLAVVNRHDAALLCQVVDGRFVGLATDAIHKPKRLDVVHHAVVFHLVQKSNQLILSGFGQTFQGLDDKLPLFLFGAEKLSLTKQSHCIRLF